MALSEIYQRIGGWMDGSGPMADIVLSSRIRLARNVVGFNFLSKTPPQERAELLTFVREKVMNSSLADELWFVDLEAISPVEREMLRERHLISRQLEKSEGASGVGISHDESFSLMVNEEDHLRMQVLASGLQLSEIYERLSRVDDLLESQMSFAFSPQLGYLTACPTNVGTGIRVSVMLHLPALKLTGQMEKFFRAAKDMNLAVRGLYGEGTEPAGDLYQMSNQVTLGKLEKNIIDDLLENAVVPVVQYERTARDHLLHRRQTILDDKILRALGILRHARMMTSEECKYLLSFVRLGIHLGRIQDVSLGQVNELFLLTQPAHLQYLKACELDAHQRDAARADLIRHHLL